MTNALKKILTFVGVLVVILTGIVYYFNLKRQKLPILSPTDINTELVDESVRHGGGHVIGDFVLIDQEGKSISNDFVKGRIHVADFFFTTCTSICPVMTTQLSRVAQEFEGDDMVKFLSFSVTPATDSPEVLKEYATDRDILYDQWRLVTGDKIQIYELARKSYFTVKEAEVGKGDGGESDFIHTNNFVLIDTQGRIRGYYDGTSLRDIDRLIEDIDILKRNG